MEQFATAVEQQKWSKEQIRSGKRIGFVPTMGALHEGHLSLVKKAQETCDVVVVSLYLNPTQFDNPDDLSSYPQSHEEDKKLCLEAGVDAVYTPNNEMMYPDGYATFVEVVGDINNGLDAATRPGHFRGVCTVVTKLFNAVLPDVAVFGAKDLQQVLILSRLVSDLNYGVEIIVGETVRDANGLALSSRNRLLQEGDREKALSLRRGLLKAKELYGTGIRDANELMTVVAEEILSEPGVALDYADVVNVPSLKDVERADDSTVIAVAAIIGEVRLIDHIHLGAAS